MESIALENASVRMNRFPVPLKFVAITLLSGMLVLMGLGNLRDRSKWMDPTDGIFWTESNGGLRAASVDSTGPGSLVGIRSGDRLLFIDGKSVSGLNDYSNLIYGAKPGAFLNYTLTDGTEERSVTIQLGSKSLLSSRDRLRTLLAFLHLGIGVFVFVRGRQFSRTFHFYLICLTAFVVYLFSYTPKLGTLDWWVYGLSIIAFLLLPALFLHFSLQFPERREAGSRLIPLLYAPALFLGLIHVLWATGHLASMGLPRTAWSSAILDRVQLIHFSAGFIIGGVLLLKRRFEAMDSVVRQQMKWISYGTLAGILPFSVIYVLPTLLGARGTFWMESSMLSLSLIPLCFGYALIRYRLRDVELIARKSAAYFIASSLLLSLYLFFVLVLGRIFHWIAPQADFLTTSIAILAIALLFAPLRNVIQNRLDRLFYRDQFENRSTIRDFARTLNSEISLVPLSQNILERISKAFQIERAAIFLAEPSSEDQFRIVHTLNRDLSLPFSVFGHEQLIATLSPDTELDLEAGGNCLHRSGPALTDTGLYYIQDLMLKGKRIGMIALGELPEGRHFSTEDMDLLAVLAGYAAMALENANLYRSIQAKAVELEHMRAYTENIIESINVAVLAMDPQGRITSCNRTFESLYGTTRQLVVDLPVEELLPPDVITSIHKASGKEDWKSVSSPTNIFKLSLENKSGSRLIVNLSLIPMQAPMGGASGALIVMDNITEKVQLEDQLLQAEKLSSIGLLAAGIAHEVNTPIAGISSYTQMLLKETPESDRRKPILQKIEKQTFRAAEIVNGLLNFSRLNSRDFKELDINQLIEDSLALLIHQLELNNIRVESRFDPSLPPVYGNIGKLQQVFVNLFLNARDAMPSGGEIAVQTGMNESMITVDISDTGTGIAEENIRRIFDPFFTTKSIGKGTGLGLAVTYGIIQEHGGGIFVDSSSGRGTRFRVKLPTRLH